MPSLTEMLAMGQVKPAVELATRRLLRDARDVEALLVLAKAALLEGRDGLAELHLQKADALGAKEDVVLIRAAAALQRQNWKEAKKLYLSLAHEEEERTEIWYGLGMALNGLNEDEAALQALVRAMESDDQVPSLHFELGLVCVKLGRAWGAARGFIRCLRLNMQHGRAWRALIDLLRQRRKPRMAERILRWGLLNAPKSQELRELRKHAASHEPSALLLQEVTNCLRRKRGREALKLVRDAQGLGARSFTLKILEAKACEILIPPDLSGAVRAYEEASAMEPLAWEARNDLALCLMRQGGPSLQRSIDVLYAAWRRLPNQPELLFNLAVAYYKAGRKADCIKLARSLVEKLHKSHSLHAPGMDLLRRLGAA